MVLPHREARATVRAEMTDHDRVVLAEGDLDAHETKIAGVRGDVAEVKSDVKKGFDRITRWLVGGLIALTTSVMMLGLNLVLKTLG